MPAPIYTIREAAEYLRLAPSTLYRFIESGILPHHRFGVKKIIFTQSDLDEFIDNCKAEKNQGARV